VTLRRVLLAAAVAGWGAGLTGCAYWNGMYNTKRFAGRAERSERAGRTSEAADRWRQVLVHADTLLARHPRSRWADDAELLKGRALVALQAWSEAVVVLESAARRAGTEDQLRQAQYWLARAYAALRQYPLALAQFDSALASPHRAQRQAVRLARGRTLLAMGRPAEAMRDFMAVEGPAAYFDRAEAALTLGLYEVAAAFADSVAGRESVREEQWRSVLDTLGRRAGPALASELVNRLLSEGGLSAGGEARVLLADGDRWAAAGHDSTAIARWVAAERVAADSAEGRAATGRLLRAALRAPDAPQRVAAVRTRLAVLSATGGEAALDIRGAWLLLVRSDSMIRGPRASDALAFLGAEWLRDSLAASALAAAAFVEMAGRFPDSPWAPKAVAAAIAAGHPMADSLWRVLVERYPESPYSRVASGTEVDEARYALLEDSLARSLQTLALPAAARTEREVEDVDEEDLRLRQAQAGERLPPAPVAPPVPVVLPIAPPGRPMLPRNPEP
jgi:tetratricopeptide (TPR) repeat protein